MMFCNLYRSSVAGRHLFVNGAGYTNKSNVEMYVGEMLLYVLSEVEGGLDMVS